MCHVTFTRRRTHTHTAKGGRCFFQQPAGSSMERCIANDANDKGKRCALGGEATRAKRRLLLWNRQLRFVSLLMHLPLAFGTLSREKNCCVSRCVRGSLRTLQASGSVDGMLLARWAEGHRDTIADCLRGPFSGPVQCANFS